MTNKYSHTSKKESHAFLIGGILILLVAGYFMSRAWWNKPEALEHEKSEENGTPEEKEFPVIEQKVLQEKLQSKEPLDLIDIRPRESFDAEHIPSSASVAPGALQSYVSPDGRPLIIIASTESMESREAAYNMLLQKSVPFFFLNGGFESWKSAGYQTVSEGDPNSFVDQSKVSYISRDELKSFLQKNTNLQAIILLDVQSRENYRKAHLAGSINIPLDELEKRSGEIESGKEIIVYGENELMSFKGGVRLADLSFFSVRTLLGNDHLANDSPLFREP